ncbi:hypothetical protein QH494_02520 [Sphingomonas sp. AR_OL41]|uniref:hypothetical protein n=1 Tax=Sphingomonas sp. AR_OL41 TaxID=3042729 RepID=UPI0024811B76|nr:hypothetical protein [Sphingomonas sp. AR_OL41]MDH7971043.1 hypothetical protein [Sphingomonas sp. AR_OL41]
MSTYDKVAAKIAKLVASDVFGDAVLSRPGSVAFNPVTGATTPASDVTIPCRAVAATITTVAQDGTLITSTELTLSVQPLEGDRLTLGGKTYVLSNVDAESPIGVPLIFYAMAKK